MIYYKWLRCVLQAASPACTELEIVVLDWLGEQTDLIGSEFHCSVQFSLVWRSVFARSYIARTC